MRREPLDGYSCSAVDLLVTSAKFGDAYQIVLRKYRVFHKKTHSLPRVCRTEVCRTKVAVKYEIHVLFQYTLRASLAVFKISGQERMNVTAIRRVYISKLFLSRLTLCHIDKQTYISFTCTRIVRQDTHHRLCYRTRQQTKEYLNINAMVVLTRQATHA